MDKHEAAVARGEEALRILGSPVFQASFDAVREAYLKQWESMPTADTEDARDLHRRLKCLKDVHTALNEHVKSGRIAQRELSMREKIRNGTRAVLHKPNRS